MTSRAACDVLVIGAGLSGLACAVRAALSGDAVILAEAHDRAGGLNSWFRRGGRELSTGLHAFTHFLPPDRAPAAAPLSRLLRQLRLKREALRLAPQKGSAIRFPSATLRFDNNPETLRASVAAAFPGQIDAFDRLVGHIDAIDEATYDHTPESARRRLASFLSEPLLIDMLCAPVFYYGSPTEGDMDWLAFCVLWKGLFRSGLAYPEGGVRPLLEALLERFRAEGGELRLGARVEKILLAEGGRRIAGARLAGGGEIRAEHIFSCAGRAETLRLVEGNPPDAARETESRISVAELLVTLNRPPSEAGLAESVLFWSARDRFDFSAPEGTVRLDHGVLAAPENYALPGPPAETPPGEHLVRASALANYGAWRAVPDYRAAKQDAGDRMLEAARLGAGLETSGRETWRDLATPLTLERYTGHARGALYGGTTKDREGRCGYERLYLIGADQGFHGLVGALLSGAAVYNRVRQRERFPSGKG